MKKVLFVTASAFVLSAAGVAQAAEPIQLGLGGYWEEWLGVVDQDESEGTTIDLQPDREIYVQGSTTLDNGITFGAAVQFEAQNPAGNHMDEAYLTISGAFGSFIIGNENSAPYLLHVGAPDVGVAIEEGDVVVGAWVEDDLDGAEGNVAPITTAILVGGGDVDKINYTLPTFAGLTLGATFVPNIDDVEGNADLTGGQQAYGVGAQYANEFNGAAVKGSLGFVFLESDEIRWLSAGLQVGFAGFTVGAAFLTDNGDDSAEAQAWDVGASYGQGPWTVSAVYFKSSSEGDPDFVGEEDERRIIQASASYTLGPGVAMKGSVARATFEDDGLENEGWAAIVGTQLNF